MNMKTKKNLSNSSPSGSSPSGLTPLKSNGSRKGMVMALGVMLALVALVVAALGYWRTKNQPIDEMKRTLGELYGINQEIFHERGEYSLNFEELWTRLKEKPKNPSLFLYGFQRNCVAKYAPHVRVASQLDASDSFSEFKLQPRTEAIRDAITTFLQPSAEEIECMRPEEGFLLFAVGPREEGSLDVWIVNHEKTIANIRPDGGASLEGI